MAADNSPREIPLTRGAKAIVDADSYDRLCSFSWHARRTPKGCTYAATTMVRPDGTKGKVLMHRFILGVWERSKEVDHKNHNGLDNRTTNLRVCTRSQNMANTRRAGYKGVKRDGNKWMARIQVDKLRMYLGAFPDAETAARAYDAAALQYHGEFACLNFN